MKLSVITVCLNSEATIRDTIHSVLMQAYEDYEYIVFDGGSTDNTVNIIKSFDDRVRLIQGKDSGIFDAMNQAIMCSTGEFVAILNSDDFYVDESVLDKVMDTVERRNVDSIYGDLLYVRRENTNRIWRVWKAGTFDKSKFKTGWCPPHPTFFIKKQVYDRFGLFDKSFYISGDYELMLRFLFKHDVSCTYLPEVLVKMRTGGNSSGKALSKIKSFAEDLRAWRLNGVGNGWFVIPLKLLRKLPQFFCISAKRFF